MKEATKTVIVKYGVPLVLSSVTLVSFLGQWEGTDRKVYADKLAGGLPTACGGLTKHTSPYPVIVGEVWSQERCDEVLELVVQKTQLKLADCLKGPVTQNQFDALSSHAHNFGVANTCASRALNLLSQGKVKEGCNALAYAPSGTPVWSYVDSGKVDKNGVKVMVFVPGLFNRRKAEVALCTKP